jgi:exosortase E/protease (VPEID-CTERM system)
MQISDGYAAEPINPVRWRSGLFARLAVVFLALAVEKLPLSFLIQATPSDSLSGAALLVRDLQHWLFRFLIVYAVVFGTLLYLRGRDLLALIAAPGATAIVRPRWLLVHGALLAPLAFLSAALYATSSTLPFGIRALAWHASALAAVAALFAGLAPAPVWLRALRQTAPLPLIAAVPAAAALLAIKGSQHLWAPAAEFTFHVVQVMLRPLCPSLRTDTATLTLITDHFSVTVSQICSGLEGVGLMIAFCTGWLWYFRRDYYFPRALLILPVAVALVFLLNAMRIAALVLIGDAGYPRIASVGFHSQAGWIAFNLAAFAVAIGARRSSWLNRSAWQLRMKQQVQPPNPAAAYLFPLLAILAAGMLAHALSAGFDMLYPLRPAAALVMLWAYRHSYRGLDWRASWRGPLVGTFVFLVWIVFANALSPQAAMPEGLAAMPPDARLAWLACRVAAAVVTVPVAEELAYRGFLMRRLVRTEFESVSWREVGWRALVLSSLAFGMVHGGLWLPGILAGLAYAYLLVRSGKIGECIIAHATTNALLAACVLTGGQWQLW